MASSEATFRSGKATIPMHCDGGCHNSSNNENVPSSKEDSEVPHNLEDALKELLAEKSILCLLMDAPDENTPANDPAPPNNPPANVLKEGSASTPSSQAKELPTLPHERPSTPVDLLVYSRLLRAEPAGAWAQLERKCEEHAHEVDQIVSPTRCAALCRMERTRLHNAVAVANFGCWVKGKDSEKRDERREKCKELLEQILNIDGENLLALMHLCLLEHKSGNDTGARKLAGRYLKAKENPLNRILYLTEHAFFYSKLNPIYYSMALKNYKEAYLLVQDDSLPTTCTVRSIYLLIAIEYAINAYRYARKPSPHKTLPRGKASEFEFIFGRCKQFLHDVCAYYDNEPPYNGRAWILWSLVYYSFCTQLTNFLLKHESVPDFTVRSDELTLQDQSKHFSIIKCQGGGCKFWRDSRHKCSFSSKSLICPHQMTTFTTILAITKCKIWDAFTLSHIAENVMDLQMNHINVLKMRELEEAMEGHRSKLAELCERDGQAASRDALPPPILQDLELIPAPKWLIQSKRSDVLQQSSNSRNSQSTNLNKNPNRATPKWRSYEQHAEVYMLLSLHVRRGGKALHQLAKVYIHTCKRFHHLQMPKHLMDEWFAPEDTPQEGDETSFDSTILGSFRTSSGIRALDNYFANITFRLSQQLFLLPSCNFLMK